jgi:hypothetical protein
MNASRSLGSEFSRRLNGDMRYWIAADAAVTLRQPPSEEQRGAMAELARQGIEETESLETYSMASSDQAADPAVVSVKSVDARLYPWYGTVELEHASRFARRWERTRPLCPALSPNASRCGPATGSSSTEWIFASLQFSPASPTASPPRPIHFPA